MHCVHWGWVWEQEVGAGQPLCLGELPTFLACLLISGDLDSPGKHSLSSGSTADSEPWHPGVQAWLPGLLQQVLEMSWVGSWQRRHWFGWAGGGLVVETHYHEGGGRCTVGSQGLGSGPEQHVALVLPALAHLLWGLCLQPSGLQSPPRAPQLP